MVVRLAGCMNGEEDKGKLLHEVLGRLVEEAGQKGCLFARREGREPLWRATEDIERSAAIAVCTAVPELTEALARVVKVMRRAVADCCRC